MGGGGVSITNCLLLGGRLRNKNLGGGGVAEEMTGLPKIAQPHQLINNDWPLSPEWTDLSKDVKINQSPYANNILKQIIMTKTGTCPKLVRRVYNMKQLVN